MIHLKDIFKEIGYTPRPGLEERIFRALHQQQAISIRKKLWLIRAELSSSLVIFFAGFFFAGQRLIQSEFWDIGKLLFSDIGSVAGSFQNYFSLLLETLPVVPLAMLFFTTFALGISIRLWTSFANRYSEGGFHKPVFTH